MSAWRSLLFVPGNRPDRFDKARAAGADSICIDLEDAVAPDQKAAAREAVAECLAHSRGAGPAVGVRINAVTSLDGCKDISTLALDLDRADFLMLPKVVSSHDIELVAGWLGAPKPLIPVIESGAGLLAAADILNHLRCGAVLFGGVDYSADVGCSLEWDGLFFARSQLAVAAASAGVPVFDVPYLDVEDSAGLIEETRRAKALGLAARAAIHPKQIAGIHDALAHTHAELDHARRVIAALEDAKGSAALLNGKLIEKPVILAAERLLAHERT